MIKKSIFIFLSFCIVSCANNAHQLRVSLDKSIPCCNAYSELKYDLLKKGRKVFFNIDEQNDSYNFDTGKSFYKGYQLPDFTNGVLVKTRVVSSFFLPVVKVLDESHNELRTIFPRLGYPTDKYELWTLQFSIETGYHERYIIIYTDPTLFDKTYPFKYTAQDLIGLTRTYTREVDIVAGGELTVSTW